MDLRKYHLTEKQIQYAAGRLLNYQPFILSDDVQTGVAYSWLYLPEGGRRAQMSDFSMDRRNVDPDSWGKFVDSNHRLRTMYDEWIDRIARQFPGGSFADVGCNNGYFVVRASERGMGPCVGFDQGDYSESIAFLNSTLGTKAEFRRRQYDGWKHSFDVDQQFDVVMSSLVMNHLSDPLYFLAFLGKLAKKAVFLFNGLIDLDQYVIRLSEPNYFNKRSAFPVCFDNDTGISSKLAFKGMEMMGFAHSVEVAYQDTWLPKSWYQNHHAILFMRENAQENAFSGAKGNGPLSEWIGRIETLLDQNDFTGAEQCSSAMVAQLGAQPMPWVVRAMVLRLLSQPIEALNAVNRSVQLQEIPEALMELIRISLAIGDQNQANKVSLYLRQRYPDWAGEAQKLMSV
jgi:SAM-dependent methyltransferase